MGIQPTIAETYTKLPQKLLERIPPVIPNLNLELSNKTSQFLAIDRYRDKVIRDKLDGELRNAEILAQSASDKGWSLGGIADGIAAKTQQTANWINDTQDKLDSTEARLGYKNGLVGLLRCLSSNQGKEDLQLTSEQFSQYRKEVLSEKTVEGQVKALVRVLDALPEDASRRLYSVASVDLPGQSYAPRLPLSVASQKFDYSQRPRELDSNIITGPNPLQQAAQGKAPDQVALNEAIRFGMLGQYGPAKSILFDILGNETQKTLSSISEQDKQALRQKTSESSDAASSVESLRESLEYRRNAMAKVIRTRAEKTGRPISEEQAAKIIDDQIKEQLKNAPESLYNKALEQETIKRLPRSLDGVKGKAVGELRNKYLDGQALHFSAEERDAFCQTVVTLSTVALTGGIAGTVGKAAAAKVAAGRLATTGTELLVNAGVFTGLEALRATPHSGSEAVKNLPTDFVKNLAMFATVSAGQLIWDRTGGSLLTKAYGIPPEQLKNGLQVGELTGNAKVVNAIGSLATEVGAFTAYGIGTQELDNALNGRQLGKDLLKRLETMTDENLKTVIGLKIANKVIGPLLERSLKGMGKKCEPLLQRIEKLQGSDNLSSEQTKQQSHRHAVDQGAETLPLQGKPGGVVPGQKAVIIPPPVPRDAEQRIEDRRVLSPSTGPRRSAEPPENKSDTKIKNVSQQVVKPVEGRPGQGYPYAHVVDVEKDYMVEMKKVGVEKGTPAYQAMLPQPKVDPATGALRAEYLEPAMRRAQSVGQNALYVEIDIGNLGGLNNEMISRSKGDRLAGMASADNVLAHISDGIRRSLEKNIGLDNVTFVRKGGDEFGIVIKDSKIVNLDNVNLGMQNSVEDVQKRYQLENIPHPKDPNKHGVGIYIGETHITPGRSIQEILDAGGIAVENAKKNASKHAAADVVVTTEKEKRTLPPDPVPPSQEEVQHSLAKQRELADFYSSDPILRTVNDPTRPFVDLDRQQKILNREFGNIFGLTEKQLAAAAAVKEIHVSDTDPTTGAQVTSSIYETRLRANSYVEQRAQRGLPHEATILDADLINMAGLNKTVGAEQANAHFRNMTSIIQNHLEDIPNAQVIAMRRPGVSMEYLVLGAPQHVVDNVFVQAKKEIDAYAKNNQLDGIHHPKWANYPEQDGVTFAAATTPIRPGEDATTQDYLLGRSLIRQERERLKPTVEKYNSQN